MRRMPEQEQGPGYRATVAALSLGQLLCWAALHYAFSAALLVLAGYRELMLVLTGLGVLSLGAFALARPPRRP